MHLMLNLIILTYDIDPHNLMVVTLVTEGIRYKMLEGSKQQCGIMVTMIRTEGLSIPSACRRNSHQNQAHTISTLSTKTPMLANMGIKENYNMMVLIPVAVTTTMMRTMTPFILTDTPFGINRGNLLQKQKSLMKVALSIVSEERYFEKIRDVVGDDAKDSF